jgi:hypothetical protein
LARLARRLLCFDSLRSARSWLAKGQNSTLKRGGGRMGVNVGHSRRAYCSRRAVRQARRMDLAVVMMSSIGTVGVDVNTLS